MRKKSDDKIIEEDHFNWKTTSQNFNEKKNNFDRYRKMSINNYENSMNENEVINHSE